MAAHIRHIDCYPSLAIGDPQRCGNNAKEARIGFITTLALKTKE